MQMYTFIAESCVNIGAGYKYLVGICMLVKGREEKCLCV